LIAPGHEAVNRFGLDSVNVRRQALGTFARLSRPLRTMRSRWKVNARVRTDSHKTILAIRAWKSIGGPRIN
jgi:hypothetical protein